MRIAAIVVLSSAVVLAGCEAANMSLTEGGPSRPRIAMAKEVSMVSSDELVGAWSCRELDPYPGQPAVTTDMTLGSDGRTTSTALLPMGTGCREPPT